MKAGLFFCNLSAGTDGDCGSSSVRAGKNIRAVLVRCGEFIELSLSNYQCPSVKICAICGKIKKKIRALVAIKT